MSRALAIGLFVAVIFISTCLTQGAGASVTLDGAGSTNSGGIFQVWTKSYRFNRDDIIVRYTQGGASTALTQYTQGLLDFVVTDRGIPIDDSSEYGDLIQFPVAGQAMVIGYSLPTLNSTDPTLILNRTVLADIWGGQVGMWDDPAIRELNPDIASKLPAQTIIVGYSTSSTALSFPEVFKLTLESFSSEFKAQFAAANRSFALLPPALRGDAQNAGGSSSARSDWLQSTPYGLTFLNYAELSQSSSAARMYNKAGTLVSPTVASVQSAMADFQTEYEAGDFTVDILDASGNDSWPMAYLTFFAMNRNMTTDDCTNVQELLDFVAWIHTNEEASVAATENSVAPLDVGLRKKLINLLNDVQCNGEGAFSTSVLVAAGAQLTLMNTWASSWSSARSKLEYYQDSGAAAKAQLASYNIDFGVSGDALGDGWDEVIQDADVLPLAALPLVPAYNLPQLSGYNLVLNAEVVSLIYRNNITTWSDQRIKAINQPEVAALLPDQPIVVITESRTSVTKLFTQWLNDTVPGWSAIGVVNNITLPAMAAQNRSIQATDGDDLIAQARATAYSFAIWNVFDVRQARILGVASLINRAGNVLRPSLNAVRNALNGFAQTRFSGEITYKSLINSPGDRSWPLATFSSAIIRQRTMASCDDARALSQFLEWTQYDSTAGLLASRQGYVLAKEAAKLEAGFLQSLKSFTCNGQTVSALASCIGSDNRLCSNAGTCTDSVCVCQSGKTGTHCEEVDSKVSDTTIAIVVGVTIPVVVLIVVVLVALILALMAIIRRNSRTQDDWEIKYDELEVGEHLGTGGFGDVSRATWKGTEVAVKVMASDRVTKDMERSFKEEVRVMTALRHPNVVLFMAACTKAPKMCIVMEFMTLGSLFDLLHNELIPEIPFALKAKMAYQASKGMHFLHSSGIVHRDLKSLNLLLDAKWNVKVSDFGLTKFKEDINKGAARDLGGSVHWTAPEVLNESGDVDLILADVYSFGIILWELLTREQPYMGLSPSAVAVSVIRDGLRPAMPASEDAALWPIEYEELITSCWHHDPTIRPTFLEIMTRLSSMHGDSTSVGGYTSKTSNSSSSSGGRSAPKQNMYGSWTLPSATTSSSNGSSNSSNASKHMSATAAGASLRPPEGEVTIVFTDITRAASLWEFNAAAMRDATLMHNEALRSALQKHRGYEVVFLRDRNSGEGSFCMAFQHAADALAWCAEAQQTLLKVDWPEALLQHPGAAEEWGDIDDRVLFKGLRVRMGVHVGTPKVVRDPMTRRVEYIGPVVNAAARITALTHGGQIVMSRAVYLKIKEQGVHNKQRILGLGFFEMPDSPTGSKLYEIKAEGLEGRFFGGVTNVDAQPLRGGQSIKRALSGDPDEMDCEAENASGGGTSVSSRSSDAGGEMQTMVGEGMMFKEDTFLTSANLCRWIIDFGEVQVGKQIGLGSYGVVFRGKWKGVEVAVKRFIKQKLDERRMLEFRAEMAFLSELHHPNIVLFIGACVKKPNLCIVTEFMKQGSLKDILGDNTIKLQWTQKLRLLRSAALGINYLHSLKPVIVHRDIKPSNLLVDENWNVKVADFGFARIKEENATMTRCGTPCWTAPEIIRGEKYDERADVFSFGVVMWQVLTRKEPFAGRNFMGVSLDVLEGKRPQVPSDAPPEFAKTMKKCWHASPDKRPKMEDVLAFFDRAIGDDPHVLRDHV